MEEDGEFTAAAVKMDICVLGMHRNDASSCFPMFKCAWNTAPNADAAAFPRSFPYWHRHGHEIVVRT